MKNITLLTGYLSNNTAGNRRIVYWVNYLFELGYKVTIITSDHFLDESVYQEIPKDIVIYELNFFSITVFKGPTKKQGTPTIGNISTGLLLLKEIKTKIITKYLGQSFDLRVLYCLPLFYYLLLAKFDKGRLAFFNKTDIVISSCPPYYTHLWGLLVKFFFKVKMVADYRDQFSENTTYTQSLVWLDRFIDKKIVAYSDITTTISKPMNNYYANWNENTHLIYNGYDDKKFSDIDYQPIRLNEVKEINYFGQINNVTRIPYPLLDFLELNKTVNMKFNFYGDCGFLRDIIEKDYYEIKPLFLFHGQLKAQEALLKMRTSDVNMILEKLDAVSFSELGTLPTKGFEYVASCRPIIAVCSQESELSIFLKNSGLLLGIISNAEDAIKVFDKFNTPLNFEPNENFIKSFSREESTQKFENILKNL